MTTSLTTEHKTTGGITFNYQRIAVRANALTDLIDTARKRSAVANAMGKTPCGEALAHVVTTLEAVRETLARQGVEYVEIADAFIDTGRLTIAQQTVLIYGTPKWMEAQ